MKQLLLIITLFFSTIGFSSPSAYYLGGIVDEKMYNEVKTYLESTEAPVIYINSPGGYLIYGEKIGDLVEKHRATCIVDGKAMSAAFYIWAKCGSQEAIRGSLIMQHYPWIMFMGPLKYKMAKRLVELGDYWRDVNFELVYGHCSYLFDDFVTCLGRKASYRVFKEMVENETIAGPEVWNHLFPGFIEVIHDK